MSALLLRLCLRAYPASIREQDGRALLDLACDLSGQDRLGVLREAAGMLLGGAKARGRMLRFDVAGAPWRAARGRLALPVAVAMLCLILVFALSGWGLWVGWWVLLFLVAAVVAVLGAAAGRRFATVGASFAVALLMVFDAFRELSTHYARWIGNVGIGEVNVFAMWLPVAVLLLVCAGAVGRVEASPGRRTKVVVCAPVAASVVLAVILRASRQGFFGYLPGGSSGLLGGVFVYAPLVFVAAFLVREMIRRDRVERIVARTAGALLVLASCLPVLWLLAMIVPGPPLAAQYLPFVYYLPGLLIGCLIMRHLIGRKQEIVTRP